MGKESLSSCDYDFKEEKHTANLSCLLNMKFDETDKSDLPYFKYSISEDQPITYGIPANQPISLPEYSNQNYSNMLKGLIEEKDDYILFDLNKLQSNLKTLQDSISLNTSYLKKSGSEKVHGPDQRLIADPSIFPYNVTGKMRMHYRIGKNKFKVRGGTGILIEDKVVLTAGHCLYNHDSKLFPEFIEFCPGLSGAITPYVAHVQKLIVHQEYFKAFHRKSDITKTTDIGLFLIDEPFGQQFGKAKVNTVDLKKPLEFIIAGYPGDKESAEGEHKGQFMWYAKSSEQKGIELVDVAGKKRFKHLIDTYNGQSGAGITYIEDTNKLYVCGVHTAGDNSYNYGVYIDEPLKQKIDNWVKILTK